jgi:glycosyltransferase involved in cell wall biosynthesis
MVEVRTQPAAPDLRPQTEAGPKLRVVVASRRELTVTGTSRYVSSLLPELTRLGVDVHLMHPAMPLPLPGGWPLRQAGIDISRFFAHYPLHMMRQDIDLYHLASQNLATLLMTQRFDRPVVVTVHDIIPYLTDKSGDRNNSRHSSPYRHSLHRWFDHLAMKGLGRADILLADSEWTRRTLIESLGLSEQRIHVAPLGIDLIRFRPGPPSPAFRATYGLPAGNRYILYVGSEDPRKNLEHLICAVAIVRRSFRDVQLLKVGPAHHDAEHRWLEVLVQLLGVADAVRWFDHVPEADLPGFYQAASVFVMPSAYEGFGLPVLEALACGTRVVCSDASALPEVAGADTIVCTPTPAELACGIQTCLKESNDRGEAARVAWARSFTWASTATKTTAAYKLAGAVKRS